MAEYAGDFGNGSHAFEGIGNLGQRSSSTVVDGGNNQFVVKHEYGGQAFAQSAADVDVRGGNGRIVIKADGFGFPNHGRHRGAA